MPDFLLCNSKLTFQMTMIPDKTNYLTQGPDGAKRLKQGPDLASYRGLSVIHSRAFSMEAGQQPRDILRRRVRTAEYYRIPPSKSNVDYEFELYNEERDTWFAMSFKDLLKFAQLGETDFGQGEEHVFSERIRVAYDEARKVSAKDPVAHGMVAMAGRLGASMEEVTLDYLEEEDTRQVREIVKKMIAVNSEGSTLRYFWDFSREFAPYHCEAVPVFDMGLQPVFSARAKVLKGCAETLQKMTSNLPFVKDREHRFAWHEPRLHHKGLESLFAKLRHQQLYKPFENGLVTADPGTPEWFQAYTYYLAVYRRNGIFMGYFKIPPNDAYEDSFKARDNARDLYAVAGSADAFERILAGVEVKDRVSRNDLHIGYQFVRGAGVSGAVNDPGHLLPSLADDDRIFWSKKGNSMGELVGRSVLMTYELLGVLMTKYHVPQTSRTVTAVEILSASPAEDIAGGDIDAFGEEFVKDLGDKTCFGDDQTNLVKVTLNLTRSIMKVVKSLMHKIGFRHGVVPVSERTLTAETLAENGVDTWPMGLTTLSRYEHPGNLSFEGEAFVRNKQHVRDSYGHLSLKFLKERERTTGQTARGVFRWDSCIASKDFGIDGDSSADPQQLITDMMRVFFGRIFSSSRTHSNIGDWVKNSECNLEVDCNVYNMNKQDLRQGPHEAIGPGVGQLKLGIDEAPAGGAEDEDEQGAGVGSVRLEDVEIVIVRPNIEHSMLGIIMGLGGNELGNTLWGQTELSVYDDSMHGIWGM